MLNCFLKASSR